MVIGICGSGTMGCSIAYSASAAECTVIVYDVYPDALTRASQRIDDMVGQAVERKKLDATAGAELTARVTFTGELDALSECDVVIEAVIEDLNVKQELLVRLESIVRESTILASNTSSIPITAIAQRCARPERVVGMHFFNPAHIMKLVEVITGKRTSPETTQAAMELAKRMGKTPIDVKDTPGFVVNRVARNFYGEALRIVAEGAATVEQVDRCMMAIGFKMGPFELMDLIGIDVNLAVTESMYEQFYGEPRFRPHPIQRNMVDAGLLGKKSGGGFYS